MFADSGWKKGGDCHSGQLTKQISEKLGLNDDQTVGLEELMAEFKDFHKAMFEARDQVKTEITALLNAPEFNREKVLVLMLEKAQKKVTVAEQEGPALVDAIAEFSESLNSEQREKAAQFIEKKMSHGWGGQDYDKKHHSG